MKRILITAFGPYGPWDTNSSWLTLVELIRNLPQVGAIATRKLPVDLTEARRLLAEDLERGVDFAVHLGQAPGSPALALEQFAINAYSESTGKPTELLSVDGPAAYRCRLPVYDWVEQLNAHGVPARVSTHAGTYLCNAVYYWTHRLSDQHGYGTQPIFIHLPLAPRQVVRSVSPEPSMTTEIAAAGVSLVVQWIAARAESSSDLRLL